MGRTFCSGLRISDVREIGRYVHPAPRREGNVHEPGGPDCEVLDVTIRFRAAVVEREATA